MILRSVLKGTGGYLPETVLSNAELAQRVETSDEWIRQRTGISQRHIAAQDQTTSDMAVEAGREAIARAGLKPEDINGVIVATTTPDRTFPSVAVTVQARLGIGQGPAFDVQAVCSGFLYALTVADSLIRTGTARRFLVIGAEKMSSIIDWEDRTTCVLFGDGAGAVVLEAETVAEKGGRGILSTRLEADGNFSEILCTTGGPATTGTSGTIRMEGKEVFRHAVHYMSEIVDRTLQDNGLSSTDIDWLLPHQANIRIIESTAKKLGLDMGKVVVTVDTHGNTSAASIPLALNAAVQDGRIREGQLVLMEALGGGPDFTPDIL